MRARFTEETCLEKRTVRRADDVEVTFTDVPAEVCRACGETCFTPAVSALMADPRGTSTPGNGPVTKS